MIMTIEAQTVQGPFLVKETGGMYEVQGYRHRIDDGVFGPTVLCDAYTKQDADFIATACNAIDHVRMHLNAWMSNRGPGFTGLVEARGES